MSSARAAHGRPLLVAFNERRHAAAALTQIRAAGLFGDQIGLLARGDAEQWTNSDADPLWGPGVAAGRLEDFGLFIASGLLGAHLAATATGDSGDTLTDAFLTLGASAAESQRALAAVERGELLLLVRGKERRHELASVLSQHSALSLNDP